MTTPHDPTSAKHCLIGFIQRQALSWKTVQKMERKRKGGAERERVKRRKALDTDKIPAMFTGVTIFCLLATFFAQGICHHDPGSHKGHLASRQCGNLLYISSTSSCCNGNITKGLSQRMADCCGSVAYNDLNEICCNDSVHTRTSAHEKCCGKALYLSTTHICCKDVIVEKKANHGCCGATLFDKTTHVCCSDTLTVKPKNEPCFTDAKDPHELTNSSTTRPPPKDPELMCGSETYNPKEQICCSGNLYRATALTMCCGDSTYTPFDENVLCCNGTLHHDVPKQSECVGDVVYTNSTCHLSARPRVGEYCCGGQTFNPKTHICCNGHSHNKKYGNFCCGSDVYNPHNQSMRCCSGRFYNLNQKQEKAECCGNVLLEHGSKKTCCSSSTLSILYDTKPKHDCCGHHYYNTSVWSCCAEHLKPTPSHNEKNTAYRLKPLMDLIPGICNKSVLFGKVESLALADQRKIVLKIVKVIKDPWLYVTLDHCSSPALENGMTYLWENNTNVYKPLSIPVDQFSDIHMFYTVCYQHECQKGG